MIHRYKVGYDDHVCGDNNYQIIYPGTFGKYPCCSKLWKKVTCKRCLSLKPRRKNVATRRHPIKETV